MDDNPDLRHLLDGPNAGGPPDEPQADQLQAIVKRAGWHAARIGAVVGVAVLVLGGLGGYLLAPASSSHTSQVATAGAPSAAGPAGAPVPTPSPGQAVSGSAGFASSSGSPGSLTRDSVRTTGAGVTVRVFTPEGSTTQTRQVEVSTEAMVGTLTVGTGVSSPGVSAAGSSAAELGSAGTFQVLGEAEKAPVIVVTAFVPAAVTEVRWTGEGAGDAAAAVGDFVALAVPVTAVPASGASIGALAYTNAGGQVVGTQKLVYVSDEIVSPPLCAVSGGRAVTAPDTPGSASAVLTPVCACPATPSSSCGDLPANSKLTCTSLPNGQTCSVASTRSTSGTTTTLPTSFNPGGPVRGLSPATVSPATVSPATVSPATVSPATVSPATAAGSAAAG